ncbi:hypothetical protein CEP54_013796 [Fusarium duplospermum]|uniref:Aldehyde dehydrogenase domain-containing protein n=1 Tax=Fusarium duplospermum TaxID=1325734 RepID=A0A428P0K7_9HYPO|nr:hypothetical protein CEP54_013796 [Fusarium duplospermum]
MQGLKVGLGTEDGTNVGPLTHERAVEKAMMHVEDAKKHGAKVLFGGFPVKELPGHFMNPTLITEMNTKMMTTCEEVFAPVLGMHRFETEEEVIRLANDCNVGLGSYIMTENISRSWRVAEAFEVGMVGVNVGVISACESPFGGVKESGYGREGGTQGLGEYMTVKSILMDVSR